MNSSMIAFLAPLCLDSGTLRISPRCLNSTFSSAVVKLAIVSVGSEERKIETHHYFQSYIQILHLHVIIRVQVNPSNYSLYIRKHEMSCEYHCSEIVR